MKTLDPFAPRSPAGRRWPEIDLLRALAGALMVANHAGVAWLSSGRPANDAITFIGSLAPVFFFTVTGLGRGVQSFGRTPGRAPKPLDDSLWKAFVLFLADAAMWLSPSRHLGLDFLGFIGLAGLVLELLDRTRRPVATISAAAVACLALRFGLAPRLHLAPDGGGALRLAHFILGDFSVPGVSYPLCPWLAYPLCGWLVGRLGAASADRIRAAPDRAAGVAALLSVAGLGFCLMLFKRHLVFFRWGTLSFAYAMLGFAAVFAGLALVLVAAARLGRAGGALSLPGIASFVLVPIHYALVALLKPPLRGSLARQPALFPPALLVLVPVVFAASKRIDRATRRLAELGAGPARVVGGGLLLSVTALLLLQMTVKLGPARTATSLIAQLLATGLFVLSSAPAAARAPSPRLRAGLPG
jgi:uncharacterized membrane protein